MEKHFECDNCKKKYFRITSFEKHRTKCLNLKKDNLKSPLSMDTLYQYILELKEQNKMLEDRLLRVEKDRKQEKTNRMNIDLWIQSAFQNISLEELNENTCKYMEGHPDEKHSTFCGRKTVEKFSYCPLHLMIVYQPKGKKEEVHLKDDEVPVFLEKKVKSA